MNKLLEEIKKFGEINDKYKFRFRPGNNYTLSNNGLIATKSSGGNNWNCIVMGDKEIPKNKKSKWKIKLNTDISGNYYDLYVGIGPNNPKGSLYEDCWSFRCDDSRLIIKGKNLLYNNLNGKLKKGDIIEVIVDRKLSNLSFAINGVNNGIACSEIPKEDILYPTIIIYEQNHIVEIIEN